jgi:hypothetical protein
MVKRTTLALGAAGAVLAGVGAWSLYQRYTTADTPYTAVARIGEVELRRYPPSVLAETTASSEGAAFRRLFQYIDGANDTVDVDAMPAEDMPATATRSGSKIPMTAPVELSTRGTSLSMPTPVETVVDDGEVRMAFYLPASFDVETAPRPTNDAVDLVVVPERTLAVKSFSWRPTPKRVRRETQRLLETLEDAAVPVTGEPMFFGYDAPGTLPFLRRNEVAIEVATV